MLGVFMFMPEVSCHASEKHWDSWLERMRCSTVARKIEIDLHARATTAHHLLAAVKSVLDFNRKTASRALLILFCGK